MLKCSVLQEKACLLDWVFLGGEEMVGTDADMMMPCIVIVGIKVFVSDGDAFCRLHIDKGYGIVGLHVVALAVDAASHVGDAQLVPVNGVVLPAFLVLMAGDVDAIDV